MRKKNKDKTRPPLKEQWPILAVGGGIVGLLAWLSWEVTRPKSGGPSGASATDPDGPVVMSPSDR